MKVEIELSDDDLERIKQVKNHLKRKKVTPAMYARYHQNLFWLGVALIHATQEDLS